MSVDSVTVLIAGDPRLAAPLTSPSTPDLETIGQVSTGDEAINRVLTDLPDVLLLDTRIEETDARAVCRRIREWAPVKVNIDICLQNCIHGLNSIVVASNVKK